MSTTDRLKIHENTNNMNYYIALFININNVFNRCDLKYILNHLNLIISKMLPNILFSCNCSCIVL